MPNLWGLALSCPSQCLGRGFLFIGSFLRAVFWVILLDLRRLLPSFLTFITYVFLYYTLVVRAFVLPFRASFHTVQWSLCWVGRGLCDPSCPRAESKLLCISVFSFHILQSVFLFRGKKTFIHFCISETSNIADSSESLIYQEGTKSGFSAYFIEAAKQLDGEEAVRRGTKAVYICFQRK